MEKPQQKFSNASNNRTNDGQNQNLSIHLCKISYWLQGMYKASTKSIENFVLVSRDVWSYSTKILDKFPYHNKQKAPQKQHYIFSELSPQILKK